MRDLILTLIVFGSVPLILFRPWVGIIMWCWLGFMNPHRYTWGFAINFPFAVVIALATITGWLFNGPKRFPFTRETVLLIFFTVWTLVTTFFALNPAAARLESERFLKIMLMVFLTLMLINNRKYLNYLIWTIVVSVGFFGVKGGLFTIVTGGNYLIWGPPDSFMEGNNEIGLALLVIIPLMLYLYRTNSNYWVKQGLRASIFLCIVAVVGTYSRGALVGLVATWCFLIWKSKRRTLLLGFTLAATLILLPLMPVSWWGRMGTISDYQADSSAMGRINAWHFAFNLANHRPLTGGGFGTFSQDLFQIYAPEPDLFVDAHSIYFEVLGEQGYLGLIVYVLLIVSLWRACTLVIRSASDDEHNRWLTELARMAQVSLAAFASSGAFLGLAYFDLYYNIVAIIVLIKMFAVEQIDSPGTAEATEW